MHKEGHKTERRRTCSDFVIGLAQYCVLLKKVNTGKIGPKQAKLDV